MKTNVNNHSVSQQSQIGRQRISKILGCSTWCACLWHLHVPERGNRWKCTKYCWCTGSLAIILCRWRRWATPFASPACSAMAFQANRWLLSTSARVIGRKGNGRGGYKATWFWAADDVFDNTRYGATADDLGEPQQGNAREKKRGANPRRVVLFLFLNKTALCLIGPPPGALIYHTKAMPPA